MVAQQAPIDKAPRFWGLFFIFLRLGLTSFGGPVAHIGYFREEFVVRRRWLSEQSYADLVAMCQFLPGPASSQVGIAIGILRQGYLGAIAAWAGFTMPSAVALIAFALGLSRLGNAVSPGLLHGLKVVAVAVVAQAIWGMARTLCIGWKRQAIALAAAATALAFTGVTTQLLIILLAAVIGLYAIAPTTRSGHEHLPVMISRRMGYLWLLLFVILLVALPVASKLSGDQWLADFSAFYRVSSLVFGGGHVVLPLLQAEVVPSGLVSADAFLAGYGIAQAVPGPLFTFAAFLGASMTVGPSGITGGLLCLLAIFTPSFLLVMGAMPFWEAMRRNRRMQAALAGINAAVVGLLVAAFYQPVWTSAIHTYLDLLLAAIAFGALVFIKAPPWLVVACCGIVGAVAPWITP